VAKNSINFSLKSNNKRDKLFAVEREGVPALFYSSVNREVHIMDREEKQ